ncbi:hypothetical protein [Selenomonas ruminantium]|uniref:Uncharacterized protein n=1 Tax=Selenomonas ruminantium TaxID=971 RepID=A0A1I0Y9F2_SELRU|nr:hypothetical protein [Selenomonas ruminantium]SFB10035.1 hypothetical protein SAMN05216587_11124 [Selenomonas ruminantium]
MTQMEWLELAFKAIDAKTPEECLHYMMQQNPEANPETLLNAIKENWKTPLLPER